MNTISKTAQEEHKTSGKVHPIHTIQTGRADNKRTGMNLVKEAGTRITGSITEAVMFADIGGWKAATLVVMNVVVVGGTGPQLHLPMDSICILTSLQQHPQQKHQPRHLM